MSGRTRLRVAVAVLGPAVLGACSLLMTEPAAPSYEVEIAFQIGAPPLGGTAAAFSRVRRAALRFTRADDATRDTVIAVVPVNGVLRAGVSLPADERIDALGISAQLGFDTITLFQGATVTPIIPGQPNTVEIPLVEVAGSVLADRDALTLDGPAASRQLSAAVLFPTGDTIDLRPVVWTSEDPTLVTVTPTGLAVAQRIGQTRLEARFDTLTDTVAVDVVPPTATATVRSWANPAGGGWSVGANWVGGQAPGPGDSVDITLDGTYTVTVDQAVPAPAAMTVGGASGAQTLQVSGAPLTVLGDLTIARTGAIELDGATLGAGSVGIGGGTTLRAANASVVNAPLDISGTLLADEGNASVSGAITSRPGSVVRVGGGVFASALTLASGFVNNGQVEIGGSSRLTVAAGTLVNAATASLSAIASPVSGTTFLTGELDNQGLVTLAQPLTIDGAAAAHVNAGTITTAATAPLTVVGADAFTSTGTIDLSNASGTFTMTGAGAGFATSGPMLVGGGTQVVITNGPFTKTGSTITGGGVFQLVDLTGTMSTPMTLGTSGPTFFQLIRSTLTTPALNTTAGTQLLMQDATLDGALDNQGNTGVLGAGTTTVTGPVTSGTTSRIDIEGGTIGSPLLTLDQPFTNNGFISLTNSLAGTDARLSVGSGFLVNAGTGQIGAAVGAGGGQRVISAQITNQGTIQPAFRLDIDGAGATHTNNGLMSTGSGGAIVVTGADRFDNNNTLAVDLADVEISLTGAGVGFANDANVIISAGRQFVVRNGQFDWTGGGFGGAGTMTLDGMTATLGSTMALGTSGPTNVTLVGSNIASPGITTAAGTTFTLDGSTWSGPVTNNGTLLVTGGAGSNVTGVLSTGATSLVRIDGSRPGTASLTVANGFTNNGEVQLTASQVGAGSTLGITTGTLSNAAGGAIRAQAGAGGGPRTIDAPVSTIGLVDLSTPLTITGQLIDPVGAPSTYNSTGAALTVSGVDVNGAVFTGMPLVSNGGTLTQFNSVTFQGMDPTAVQFTLDHPGTGSSFLASGLTFSTPPSGGGAYVSVRDSNGVSAFLTFEIISSSPASGFGQSLTSGGAILIW